MEAIWNLEQKCNLSTQEAILVLTCAASAVIGVCAVIVMRKKVPKKKLTDQERNEICPIDIGWSDQGCGWISIKKGLMGSVRWSKPDKWEERNSGWWREGRMPMPPLLGGGLDGRGVSRNSESPVWQRPILMGEKCELPRFSGLILYDEKGQLLHDSFRDSSYNETIRQEKTSAVVKTTLKDLLRSQFYGASCNQTSCEIEM